MRIIVLWEDQLDVDVRNFGPGTLLAACVADRLRCQMTQVAPLLKSIPRKGNGGIRKTLRSDFVQLEKSGPVFVVLDRDKMKDLWRNTHPHVNDCMTGHRQRLQAEAPGDYDVVFLHQNMESLIQAACDAGRVLAPTAKPTPSERDKYLNRLVWHEGSEPRARLCELSPSFDRLATRVAEKLRTYV